MNLQNREKPRGKRPMDPTIFLQTDFTGAFFETVVITILIALTFITIILAFLYMTFTREETEKS